MYSRVENNNMTAATTSKRVSHGVKITTEIVKTTADVVSGIANLFSIAARLLQPILTYVPFAGLFAEIISRQMELFKEANSKKNNLFTRMMRGALSLLILGAAIVGTVVSSLSLHMWVVSTALDFLRWVVKGVSSLKNYLIANKEDRAQAKEKLIATGKNLFIGALVLVGAIVSIFALPIGLAIIAAAIGLKIANTFISKRNKPQAVVTEPQPAVKDEVQSTAHIQATLSKAPAVAAKNVVKNITYKDISTPAANSASMPKLSQQQQMWVRANPNVETKEAAPRISLRA